jgi:hypothetical protein
MYDNDGIVLLIVPTDGRSQITIFAEELLITLPDGTTVTYPVYPSTPPPPASELFLPVVLG